MQWQHLIRALALLGCVTSAATLFSCGRSSGPVDVIVAFSDSRSTLWQWWTGIMFSPALSHFINSLLAHFDYSRYRVAVMAFSNTARIIAPFSENLMDLQRSLVMFRAEFGGCHMSQAVGRARNYFRTDGRPNAARIVIVVAGDPSGDNFQLGALSYDAFRQDRIQFIGVGYRNPFIRPQLEALTGDPRAVFYAANDYALFLFVRTILTVICELLRWPTTTQATTVPTTLAPSLPRNQIVLVIDDSESTRRFRGLDFFHAPGIGSFLEAFTQGLNASLCPTGLLLFSDSARRLCEPTDNPATLTRCVDRVSDYLEFGGSRTSLGLRSAQGLLTSQGVGNKYVIVLTDGCSEDRSATASASQDLDNLGVQVMAVGFPNPTGTALNLAELEVITQDRAQVFTVPSDSDLPSLVGSLLGVVCPAAA